MEAVNSVRRARSRPPWSLNAYSSLTIPGPDLAVKSSRLSNVGVDTSRNPKDSASWMNRDSTKRRFAMSSGPQSLVPRGRSTIGTPGVGGGSPLTFLREALDETRKRLSLDSADLHVGGPGDVRGRTLPAFALPADESLSLERSYRSAALISAEAEGTQGLRSSRRQAATRSANSAFARPAYASISASVRRRASESEADRKSVV